MDDGNIATENPVCKFRPGPLRYLGILHFAYDDFARRCPNQSIIEHFGVILFETAVSRLALEVQVVKHFTFGHGIFVPETEASDWIIVLDPELRHYR